MTTADPRHALAREAPALQPQERLVFLTRQLTLGGAERQLVQLAVALRQRGLDVHVVVMYGDGELEADLRTSDVPVHVLGKRGRYDVIRFGWRLFRTLRWLRPSVLHGYLPMDNLLVTATAPFLPGTRRIWGVRASHLEHARQDWLSRATSRLEVLASRSADVVIANSQAGRAHVIRRGFDSARVIVIPNGIDTDRFAPDPATRRRMRQAWGIDDDVPLVGIVGRLDPMKDHRTFLAAAGLVAAARPSVRFVIVGRGPDDYAAGLRAEASRIGIEDRVVWAGALRDAAAAFTALDLLVSSSTGEGFSNAIAEGLACGVPAVVTDVGDSRTIVGSGGLVVPVGDPPALAEAMLTVLDDVGQFVGHARRGIVTRYSTDRMASTFQNAIWPSG